MKRVFGALASLGELCGRLSVCGVRLVGSGVSHAFPKHERLIPLDLLALWYDSKVTQMIG